MSAPSPAESTSPGARRRTLLAEAGLLGLLWIALMQPLRTLAPSLDSSWQMMLGYAYDHGLVYGRDLVPTMGPAGFLFVASPAVHHLGIRLGWMLLGNAAFAGIFWHLSRRLGGVARFCYFAVLILLVAPAPESMQGLVILILGLGLLRPNLRTSAVRLGLVAAAMGWLALFKFTHLTLAAALVAIAAVHAGCRDGIRGGLAIAGAFAAGFLGGWIVLGQPLGALPAFLSLSAEISRGYVDAMSIFEGPALFACGLAALATVTFYAWAYWRIETDRWRAHATVLMLAAVWFLNWKHGFVRADGHSLTLFLVCLFPAVAYPALLDEPVTSGQRRRTALAAGVALAGIAVGYTPALTQSLATFNTRLNENVSLLAGLVRPDTFAERQRAAFAAFGRERRLPRITAIVGQASMDVLGTAQAIAMFDDFHYTPRPVFQDYYVFTPRLAQLNEAFYASPRAPHFVVQRYETIDDRVPGLDDARVQYLLYTHYALVAEENGWLLWERLTPPTVPVRAGGTAQTAHFDSVVPVPSFPEHALWVRIDATLSLRGKVQAFLYKPPQLTLELTDATGAVHRHRMVRAMAADGFILAPFFADQAALRGYFTGHDPVAIRSLRVVAPPGDRSAFQPAIAVSFISLPLLPRPPPPRAATGEVKFRMFNLEPVRVDSPHPSGPFVLDGHETFFIHAPGEMEFQPDLAVTHLRGAVGLSPGAYAGPQKTDGVEIVIEHISAAGRHTILWQRTLDPANRLADRGLQPFDLALPGRGRVLLRNLTGAKGDPSFDWTLWSDLRFE